MPTWQAERYSSRRVSSASADSAPLAPSFARTSSRDRRARTSANSAATKRPFKSTRRTSSARRRAVIARPAGPSGSPLPYAASYSEVDLRRSSGPAEPRLARGSSAIRRLLGRGSADGARGGRSATSGAPPEQTGGAVRVAGGEIAEDVQSAAGLPPLIGEPP